MIHASHCKVGTVSEINLIVVENSDVLLVANQRQSQHAKKLLNALEQQKREHLTLHRKVKHLCGWLDRIGEEARFTIKCI